MKQLEKKEHHNKKRILVTGGAGFIGSHVCKALNQAGYLPISYDNLSRGNEWAVKWGPLLKGVSFLFGDGLLKKVDDCTVITNSGKKLTAGKIINCAGLYADKIARGFGFSRDYKIIPFKGIYLKYSGNDNPVRTNIYPVPNLRNPFLGVHYTVTVDGHIKIGPTAIPAFWRENYSGLDKFSISEFLDVSITESSLLMTNKFNFRGLAFEEMRKYWKPYYRSLAAGLVNSIDTSKFSEWTRPGIRAQLLNISTKELVQDFVVEGDDKSVHILNAVSPAFTCSFPFAEYVVNKYIIN